MPDKTAQTLHNRVHEAIFGPGSSWSPGLKQRYIFCANQYEKNDKSR